MRVGRVYCLLSPAINDRYPDTPSNLRGGPHSITVRIGKRSRRGCSSAAHRPGDDPVVLEDIHRSFHEQRDHAVAQNARRANLGVNAGMPASMKAFAKRPG
jgi:hypothetical protein